MTLWGWTRAIPPWWYGQFLEDKCTFREEEYRCGKRDCIYDTDDCFVRNPVVFHPVMETRTSEYRKCQWIEVQRISIRPTSIREAHPQLFRGRRFAANARSTKITFLAMTCTPRYTWIPVRTRHDRGAISSRGKIKKIAHRVLLFKMLLRWFLLIIRYEFLVRINFGVAPTSI